MISLRRRKLAHIVDMSQITELQALFEQKDRLRNEYRERESALRAEFLAEESRLRQELFDKSAEVDRQILSSLSLANPSTMRATSSNQVTAYGHTVDTVTSSSPVDTTGLQCTEPVSPQPQAAGTALDAALSTEAHTHHATTSSQLDPDHSSSNGAAANDTPAASMQQVHSEFKVAAVSRNQLPETAIRPATSTSSLPETEVQLEAAASASPPSSPCITSPARPDEIIDIDVSHVVPVQEQRTTGTTTYVICRPARQAGMWSWCILTGHCTKCLLLWARVSIL